MQVKIRVSRTIQIHQYEPFTVEIEETLENVPDDDIEVIRLKRLQELTSVIESQMVAAREAGQSGRW